MRQILAVKAKYSFLKLIECYFDNYTKYCDLI